VFYIFKKSIKTKFLSQRSYFSYYYKMENGIFISNVFIECFSNWNFGV